MKRFLQLIDEFRQRLIGETELLLDESPDGNSATAAQAGPSISWIAVSSASEVGVPLRP